MAAKVEEVVTDISEATGAPKQEVKEQVEKRIDGADGDVEKAVDEAKAEFDGEKKGGKKGNKGPKPEIIEEAQEGDDADADVEEKVEGLARKAEYGDVEGLKEEGRKCKKGGKKGGKPEETEEAQKKGKGPKPEIIEEAQEGEEEATEDKPAKGGDKK